MHKFLMISFLLLPVAFALPSDGKFKDEPWLPMVERIKIWDEVVGKGTIQGLPSLIAKGGLWPAGATS